MKLLIITQKVDINDPVLGFFHRWVEEFSKHFERVTIICLYQGSYNLPKNARVLSLGKEAGVNKLKYIYRFYKYIWQERNNYDSVFVHMNPEYVLLGGVFWKILRKKILLWYIHPQVNNFLKIAHFFADNILSASKSSFPFATEKLIATGHGIDINLFKKNLAIKKQLNSILYLGRISPIKHIDLLIDAARSLNHQNIAFNLDIIGDISTKDQWYLREIRVLSKDLEKKKKVSFLESVPNKNIPEICNRHEVLVNLTNSGSLDKVILEAMACECLILTSNKALEHTIPSGFFITDNNPINLAEKIKFVINLNQQQKEEYGKQFRQYVAANHNLENLVKKIKIIYENIN